MRVHQEGPEKESEYQGVLLLLAIMIGFPNDCPTVFNQISSSETSLATKFTKLLNPIPSETTPSSQKLWDTLNQINQKEHSTPNKTLEIPISTLQRFLPLVTRFSFRMEL